jgi:hypothetical protein
MKTMKRTKKKKKSKKLQVHTADRTRNPDFENKTDQQSTSQIDDWNTKTSQMTTCLQSDEHGSRNDDVHGRKQRKKHMEWKM